MATIQFKEGPRGSGPATSLPQLLPNIVDGMAAARPHAVYMEFPRNPQSYADGFLRIDYSTFANVVNGLTWWLDTTLGRSETFETLLFVGDNDIRYNSFVFAAVKAGYKTLWISPTSSVSYQATLLTNMGCVKVFTTGKEVPDFMKPVLEVYSMQILQVPSVTQLTDTRFPYYAFEKTFDAAKDEPLVCVHTSGSTGPPKARVLTHSWASGYIHWQQLEPPEGFESNDKLWQSNRVVVMTPPFHVGNAMATLMSAIANQTTIILPSPSRPKNARTFLEVLDHVFADACFFGPATVDELGKSPSLTSLLNNRISTIFWAGGSISETAGNALSKHCKLFNINGSSEAGGYPLLRPAGDWDPTLWGYICVHPAAGPVFEHVADDLYVLILDREKAEGHLQPAFALFPKERRFDTKDLFQRHPTREGFWLFRARTDDVINLANALKCNPVPVEGMLVGHPRVKGALVGGQGRMELALLLEPVDGNESGFKVEEFIGEIWPLVERANEEVLGAQAVRREMIIVATTAKPMARAGKGTVQRALTLALYEREFDVLYEREDAKRAGS